MTAKTRSSWWKPNWRDQPSHRGERQAASAAVLAEDNENIQKFIHDPRLEQKQRENGQHDDKSAIELLNLMPEAFVWTVESRTPDLITLSYKPNPNFDPTSMEARVMGAMSGTLTVTGQAHRIKSFRGRLMNDVRSVRTAGADQGGQHV